MPLQRSFEELGTPLSDVTFCVVDLETTGGSHVDSAITEIGAVKVRCGEVDGTFHTLVDPGQPVPAFIRLLTGITDDLLLGAPDIEAVLPSLAGFLKGSVLVAHNARFDVGFLNAALRRFDHPELDNPVVDTALLARKILAGEVPNHKLSTLARYLRCAHQPSHRAFEDVLATIDVLHHLIERVAGFGVTTLEDLVSISSTRLDGTINKIGLTEDLPRAGGVYRFIGGSGQTLYVGKATDIRSRVRSYFYGDPRRRIRDLLRETDRIDARTYPTMLEAEIAEARAISDEQPPYNRAGKRPATWYLKLALKASIPKISPARVPKDDGSLYVGPFPGMRYVRSLIDALRDVTAIHRCTEPRACNRCAFAQFGTCEGHQERTHRREVRKAARALLGDHEPLLKALADRMHRLARGERFEEAAEVRERALALQRSLERHLEIGALARAGDVAIIIGARVLLLRAGRLLAAADHGGDVDGTVVRLRATGEPTPPPPYLTQEVAREARIILSALKGGRSDIRVAFVERPWVMPVTARPVSYFVVSDAERTRARHPVEESVDRFSTGARAGLRVS
jgi:DNA polymerase-3 subunit epsilon